MPGVGSYETNKIPTKIGGSYSMGVKHFDPIQKEIESTPGPGAFDPHPERIKPRAPGYTMKPILQGPKTE